MIECKPYKMTMLTPTTCIRNQESLREILKERENRSTQYQQSNPILQAMPARYNRIKKCHGCKIGEEFYQKYLSGEDIGMPEKETKICKCGQIFERREGQGQLSWNRTLNCPDCRAMSPYDRKKAHAAVENSEAKSSKPTVKQRVCRVCKKPMDLTAENFHRDKRDPEGFKDLCKKCRNGIERARTAMKPKASRILQVDISMLPDDLVQKLEQEARENFRTPAGQVAYLLSRGLAA